MTSLARDHAACEEMLRRSASSFALPIRLLPAEKRRGTTALYAFCRRADDIVDDAADPAAAGMALDAFESECRAALGGGDVDDPVLRAVADTARRFAVPKEYLQAVLDGVRMDLTRQTYATFGELEVYCGRVAGAVGLAAIHIWGFRTPEAISAGHACGLAFQLTNILRDIPEDLARGRIYIPLEDLLAHGCSADDLRAGRIGPGFERLAAFEVGRALDFYLEAAPLDRMLSTDGRLVFRAMFGVYRAMLTAVRRAGAGVFQAKVRPRRPVLAAAAFLTLATGPRP